MRRYLILGASVLVSALFLWLALKDVPLQEIWNNIQHANLLWIGVAFLSVTAGLYLRAIRWRGLVDDKISTMRSFHILNITFLLNQLPLRAGEVARSLLATREHIPVLTAATSIVVERLLDTVLVVVWLALALTRVPDAPPEITVTAALFGVAAVGAFVILIVFARFPNLAHWSLNLVERILPFLKRLPLERLLDNVLDGLKPLTNWKRAAHAIIWTLISWSVSLFTFFALELALDVPNIAPGTDLFLMAVIAVTMASFSIAIPVSVASFGPFEGAVLIAGKALGMDDAIALSLGFIAHGITVLGYAVWGTIALLVMGVSLGDVLSGGTEKPAESPVEVEGRV
ncbi:MAG: flippase-like domain-containing protein [Anaerolineaceae bacterium]|nr:flippase-like domain-containing protein [Anaerolineaceae bacterium]